MLISCYIIDIVKQDYELNIAMSMILERKKYIRQISQTEGITFDMIINYHSSLQANNNYFLVLKTLTTHYFLDDVFQWYRYLARIINPLLFKAPASFIVSQTQILCYRGERVKRVLFYRINVLLAIFQF